MSNANSRDDGMFDLDDDARDAVEDVIRVSQSGEGWRFAGLFAVAGNPETGQYYVREVLEVNDEGRTAMLEMLLGQDSEEASDSDVEEEPTQH